MKLFFNYVLILLVSTTLYNNYPEKMIINVPVADLRKEPIDIPADFTLPAADEQNPLQETQLLLGEYIIAHYEYTDEKNITWIKIGALQQERYAFINECCAFPGWIQKDQAFAVEQFPEYNLVVKDQVSMLFDQNLQPLFNISIGTRLQGINHLDNLWQIVLPDNTIAYINDSAVYVIEYNVTESIDTIRIHIINQAKTFLQYWYTWGGRSAQHPDFGAASGVDCSGLTSLCYLTQGLQIPRFSHEQFLKANRIFYRKDLQPGDLIFFAPVDQAEFHIDHVMMYIGDDLILESTYADDKVVRIIPFVERIGQIRSNTKSGDIIQTTNVDGSREDQHYVYFASFLQDQNMIQQLRKAALESQIFNPNCLRLP